MNESNSGAHTSFSQKCAFPETEITVVCFGINFVFMSIYPPDQEGGVKGGKRAPNKARPESKRIVTQDGGNNYGN